MVKNKELLREKSATPKKEKKKFNKNSSFSGVESKKSPKNRRKSLATVLPTPLKKKKKSSNEWTVSESGGEDTELQRKQFVITDSTKDDVEVNLSPLKTPKIKSKKRSQTPIVVSEKKKHVKKPLKKQITSIDDEKKIELSEIESEKKFGIDSNTIAKAIEAVIKLRKENPKLQNQLFDDPIEIYLQVSCHKVARGPSRIIRIPIPNSILTPDDEICLIVPELKGVKNIEHETHIEHYENLLKNKGVENIKKIMTFHQFRTEYETFEQKSRLVDLYDMFLVDGRISGKVVSKCGKIFYKKRKVPTAVKLQATKLKEHIDKALSKAFFLLHLKGDSYSVQLGHDKMSTQDLVDNVFAAIECLSKEIPGGFENIKGLHIAAKRATSIPIYSSFTSPTEVTLPKVKSKKPKAYKTYKGELTTLLNADVIVRPTGEVIVKRTNLEEDDVENDGKKNSSKTKKAKKRKQVEEVSNDNVEGNLEEKTVTKIKKVKVNKEKDNSEDIETKDDIVEKKVKKKKSKVVVDVTKKEKKNKKIKKQS